MGINRGWRESLGRSYLCPSDDRRFAGWQGVVVGDMYPNRMACRCVGEGRTGDEGGGEEEGQKREGGRREEGLSPRVPLGRILSARLGMRIWV